MYSNKFTFVLPYLPWKLISFAKNDICIHGFCVTESHVCLSFSIHTLKPHQEHNEWINWHFICALTLILHWTMEQTNTHTRFILWKRNAINYTDIRARELKGHLPYQTKSKTIAANKRIDERKQKIHSKRKPLEFSLLSTTFPSKNSEFCFLRLFYWITPNGKHWN